MKRLLLLAAFGATLEISALVEHRIDPKTAPQISFSSTSPNRISCEEGSIVDMVYDQNRFSGFIHQKTGQAFVTPLLTESDEPSSITLITSFGESQTIQVVSQPGSGEIVVLKGKPEAKEEQILTTDYHSQTISFLNALLCGETPYGYGDCAHAQNRELKLKQPFKHERIKTLEGPFEIIHVYQVENASKRPQTLSLSSSKESQDVWVFQEKKDLFPGEKILAIISSKKE